MMWPILLCSLAAVMVVFERVMFFMSIKEDPASLKVRVFDEVRKSRIKEAMILCEGSSSPVGPVLKAGLLKFGRRREEIAGVMDEAARFEIPQLEKGLRFLSMVAGVTPLLGLLGTVMGMGRSFHMMQARSAAMNPAMPADAAAGIWQALITSAAGLLVAIFASVALGCLSGHARTMVLAMEKAALDLAGFLADTSETSVVDNNEG